MSRQNPRDMYQDFLTHIRGDSEGKAEVPSRAKKYALRTTIAGTALALFPVPSFNPEAPEPAPISETCVETDEYLEVQFATLGQLAFAKLQGEAVAWWPQAPASCAPPTAK